MRAYDHKKIEKKWQTFWAKNKIYSTPDKAPGKDNFYLLVEFPYPSGNLHVGHWYAFAVPDILARTMRMQGKNVLYPIGFDAFGLPAENAAIKNKLNPRAWTEDNMAYMEGQIRSMGASFDWSRKVVTCDPAYYRWTQWLFLQLFKKGLVYQKETAVNWCPKDKTVLANEQVVDGKCERCETEVVQKMMLQWNVKITEYADRLIDDLEPLNWPKPIKESQRSWIGRSEGAEVDFPIVEKDVKRIVLLHGRQGSAHTEFFPWLKKKLEALGYEVQAPELPNAEEPDDEEQADFVEQHCTLDEHTAILGHSFGGVVALRLLERGTKVKRTVLVSMPFSGTYLDEKKRPSVTKALKKGFDFEKLKEVVEIAVTFLDRVVDVNFYPTVEAKNSNSKWRPIGLGVMGLQDALFKMRIPFESSEAKKVSSYISENIYFQALKTSSGIAKTAGSFPAFAESRYKQGKLQVQLAQDLQPSIPELHFEWGKMAEEIQHHGLRNSLLIAIAPTATIASIAGCYESIEPQLSNFFKRETLSGEFLTVNRYLIQDLKKLNLWNGKMRTKIIEAEGSIQTIEEIPQELKNLYKTVWEISQKTLIEMAAERSTFVCQSQSLNLFLEDPTLGKLSSMYMYAWKQGIKTTYYLRSRAKTSIKKTTTADVTPEKAIACSLENPESCEVCQ